VSLITKQSNTHQHTRRQHIWRQQPHDGVYILRNPCSQQPSMANLYTDSWCSEICFNLRLGQLRQSTNPYSHPYRPPRLPTHFDIRQNGFSILKLVLKWACWFVKWRSTRSSYFFLSFTFSECTYVPRFSHTCNNNWQHLQWLCSESNRPRQPRLPDTHSICSVYMCFHWLNLFRNIKFVKFCRESYSSGAHVVSSSTDCL